MTARLADAGSRTEDANPLTSTPDALSPTQVQALASGVIDAGPRLLAAGAERRARWLSDAFARIADGALTSEAVRVLAASAGLSEPMVAWALESALKPLTYDALRDLAQRPAAPHPGAQRARPGALCAVVIAGNVVTGAARAVGIPLLFGWPVLAKASSHDAALARLLEPALAASDPELASAYRAVCFDAANEALSAPLFARADAVSAYGSDASLRAIRGQLGAHVSFLGHGHGLGAALVARPALDPQRARGAARALALDVAAYDQRGCLSPHVVWVERGGPVSPEAFAELVFEELAALQTALPRGPLPPEAGGAQLTWRGVGALRGNLHEGEGFAVTFEAGGPLRVSPGYRNLQVLALAGLDALPPQLAPLGPHLKCLGLAGVDAGALARALPLRVAPRLCALGEMQRPPVDALQDGLPAWEGLVRWVDVEAR